MSSHVGSSTAGSRPGIRQRSLAAGNAFLRILPALRSMIAEFEQQQTSVSFESLPRDGTNREEIGRVSAALFIIEHHIRNIRESRQDESFETSISSLAEYVCSFTESQTRAGNTTKGGNLSDARLLGVQEFSDASRKSDCPDDPAKVILNSRSSQDWAVFSEDLATLTDQIQTGGNDLTLRILHRDQSNSQPRLAEDASELLSQTFEAITCACETKPVREMRVRLGAYKRPKSAEVEDVTILTKEPVATTWAEIRFHRSLESTVPKDLNYDSGHGTSQQAAEQQNGQLDRCICGYYQHWFRPQHWRLNVQILGSRLSRHWVDQTRSLPIASLQHQIDLKVMISRQGSTMTGVAKLTLSVILAYSLFYLYGGSWSKVRWKRDHIIFFIDDNNKIPMRAFLKVPESTQSNKGKGVTTEELHRYPAFLELAIMLLEINFGQSLEEMLSIEENIETLNDSWCAASEVFSEEKWKIEHPGLRDAIALCLKPDFGMFFTDHGDPDHNALRSKFLNCVVQPLERDLQHAFQHFISVDDLDDEAPEKIVLPFILQKTRPMSHAASPEDVVETTILQEDYRDCAPANSSPPVPLAKLRAAPFPPSEGDFTLFNNESQTSGELSSHLTDKWARRFNDLVRSHISEDRGRRLKVAILDTGINAAHPEFYGESRIKALKSWTASQPDVDTSGHGTHIASTILSLTLNVDLYIGKITETNALQNTDIIADAIQFACDGDEWDVDILSLSFGFPRGVRCIHDSIDKAVARNKIVFAAASNDGSNTARTYPASHDRVIAVHSTDGHGNRSAFNPTPVQHDDNFCVLGEELEGAWSDNGVRRMSGTSFAVPISISIASFMIGFISQRAPHYENWLVPLIGFEGMRVIFRLLSERRDSGYDLVNPLAHFSRGGISVNAFLRAVESILDR